MKASFPYRRIGPRITRVTGRDTLWLGEGHLLAVHNMHFVETYLRFDLREIQAIVLRKEFRFVMPVYWLFGCFVAFIVAIAATAQNNSIVAREAWSILALLVIYWLFASLARSCSVYLRTAVASYQLPGLYRERSARRALQILQDRIVEVQGVLPEDWTMVETPDSAPARLGGPAAPEKPASPVFPILACTAFFLDALLSWMVRSPRAFPPLHNLSVSVTFVAVVLPVIAIVATRRDKRYQHIRVLFMIAVFAVGFANYGSTIVTAFIAGIQRTGQASPEAFGAFDNFLYWLNQIAEIGVGTLGLLALATEVRNTAPGRHPSEP